MQIAIKSLLLFLQSLPTGSYYKIIGFGSIFKKYDKWPREYTQENIMTSINLIKSLEANIQGLIYIGHYKIFMNLKNMIILI